MRIARSTSALLAATALILGAHGAGAGDGDGKSAPPKSQPAKPPEKVAKYDGPEIRWARSWDEAVEEAAERNVLMFLHSHGST